jgi:hypothetical protein
MSPARDEMLDDIRRAIERLNAAERPCNESDIAAELGMTEARLHAAMRQLFSEGRRTDIEPVEAPEADSPHRRK